MLEFRNDESMQEHNVSLRQLSADQKAESEHMARLTSQTVRDSKLLKSLTALATLYLPASLLAVSQSILSCRSDFFKYSLVSDDI